MQYVRWIVIAICLAHSATFSGLNLAVFNISRLRLEVEASSGDRAAARILPLRKDSHFLLTTILWGNVGFNALLAIVSNSFLAGGIAFVFSTVVITIIGEIIPQAYFARHALPTAARLVPFLRLYQIVLFPVAKPSAMVLDWWLGREGIQYFREQHLREVIKKHIEVNESEVTALEGLGALNFLAFDDLKVSQEGEPADPDSIISLPFEQTKPIFPEIQRVASDPFLQKIERSSKKWVILTNTEGKPVLVLDSDAFLRDALFETGTFDPQQYCHRPIIVSDVTTPLGDVVAQLRVEPEHPGDDVVDRDIILVWGDDKRVITGADILGRLLHGIVMRGGDKPQD